MQKKKETNRGGKSKTNEVCRHKPQHARAVSSQTQIVPFTLFQAQHVKCTVAPVNVGGSKLQCLWEGRIKWKRNRNNKTRSVCVVEEAKS